MEDKDIVGKKFTCFEFKPTDGLVRWDKFYEECVGKNATVLEINNMHPQYAYVKINISIGKTRNLHYPVQMIKDQFEAKERENMSIDDILSEMKQLTSKI